MKTIFKAIGVARSPFKNLQDIPEEIKRDSRKFSAVKGTLEIFPEYAEGLRDIEGFSHLIVIFAFDRSLKGALTARPPYDGKERGVFSTRSPRRPNPIGLTVVRLTGKEGSRLKVTGLDMIDGTPILDIKPYTDRDRKSNIRLGWLTPFRSSSGRKKFSPPSEENSV